jgi:Ser/Thr protein kinase RdoA (MazF antagonist)
MVPAVRSVLSPQALLAEALPAYELGEPLSCELLHCGLNDSYRVRTPRGPYLLRVYRAGWRMLSDIAYELEALVHLARRGVGVALPVARYDGSFVQTLQAAEGARSAVLFAFAPGAPLALTGPDATAHASRFGGAAAALHAATDDFRSLQPRFVLDEEQLLEQPLAALLPFLAQRAAERDRLLHIAATLRERLSAVAREPLDTGFCHGDLHDGNARITEELALTLFDFDCCGRGWRAYDLAVFRWSLAGLGLAPATRGALWEAFLAGYQARRPLGRSDLAAVPLFLVLRQIWYLGLEASFAPERGSRHVDEQLARELPFLWRWEAEYLTAQGQDNVASDTA